MLCTACGTAFTPKRHQEGPRYCSTKCRAAFWREQRARVISAALDEAERALQKARLALVVSDRKGMGSPNEII